MATPTPDNGYSTLANIQQKVRRLTRTPSVNQLTDTELNNYINTFVLYDFPEHLRLFNLKKTFEFYTQPYVDVYQTNTTDTTNPLYNFSNKYITVHPPIYVAGFPAGFYEDQATFYGIYPKLNSIASIGTTGNGTATSFSGVVNAAQANTAGINGQTICLLQNNVLFDSIDVNNNGLALIDYPISNTIGNLFVPGGAPTSTTVQDTVNYINYITGQFVITFPTAPGVGQPINSQTVPQNPVRPLSMLFFDGKFILRPVPDQPYKVQFDVFARPSELLNTGDSPELSEWWQYIAYGAAKKIFEDRTDLESVSQIMAEFKTQGILINRRTIVQQTSQRTATIYSQNAWGTGPYNNGFWNNGGF